MWHNNCKASNRCLTKHKCHDRNVHFHFVLISQEKLSSQSVLYQNTYFDNESNQLSAKHRYSMKIIKLNCILLGQQPRKHLRIKLMRRKWLLTLQQSWTPGLEFHMPCSLREFLQSHGEAAKEQEGSGRASNPGSSHPLLQLSPASNSAVVARRHHGHHRPTLTFFR